MQESIDTLFRAGRPRDQGRAESDIIEAIEASGVDGLTAMAISHGLFRRNMPIGIIRAALRSLWEAGRIVGRVERRNSIGRPSVVWRLAEFDQNGTDGQVTPKAASLLDASEVSRETPRAFSSDQKRDIWFNAGGRCCICRVALGPDWHADHRVPWSAGGETTTENAWALCPKCNLRKSSMRVDEDDEASG